MDFEAAYRVKLTMLERHIIKEVGLYLIWIETALSASLLATTGIDHWTRYLLIASMSFGLIAYVFVAGFFLVYLAVKRPAFLFNPSDYDSSVQHHLFDASAPKIRVKPKAKQTE
ncbi:hypothetical protein [Methylomagnum sp.]